MPTLVILATSDSALAQAWERQLPPGRIALRLTERAFPGGTAPGFAAVVILDAVAGLWCVNIGYGRTEIADAIAEQARQLAYYHTYGMPTLTTHCSNNYGPYHFPEKLIPLVILNALAGKPLPIYGDGQQVRDWLYVEDHCRGLLLALLKGRSGETYCLGGRSEKPNLEVVHTLISLVTAKLPAEQRRAEQPVPDRRGDPEVAAVVGMVAAMEQRTPTA